jgi:YebC/PmpR family DNA-binding regulatory protein
MPKDNIERAIKRGTGESQGEQLEELQYEGYGPEGIAVLIDVLTDNRNRTAGEVRKIFERAGGKMASAGNVAFLFDRRGVFAVSTTAIDEESLMGLALEAGADDVKQNGPNYEIICDPGAFSQIQSALKAKNIEPVASEVMALPKAPKDIDVEAGKRILKLVEALDDHDDVQHVYTDMNVTEAMMAE